MKKLFTSESVCEGHPDKICDLIADSILDEALSGDPKSRVACEVCCTTGMILVMGEFNTKKYIDIPGVARRSQTPPPRLVKGGVPRRCASPVT